MKREEIIKWLDTDPTIQELKRFAKSLGLRVRKAMKKKDVIKLIREHVENTSVTSASSGAPALKQETPADLTLPRTYNKNKLVLMPVNPYVVFSYWDFDDETRNLMKQKAREGKAVIRLYDVTFIMFDGTNAHRTFEYRLDETTLEAGNFYFQVPMPKADYLSEMGYLDDEGRFFPVMRSNVARTPAASPSTSSRERWYDLRSKKRSVILSEGSLVKPIEKLRGVTSPGWPSGQGIGIMWEIFRSGR
ncbi:MULTISPECIES: DUF4912 domain-containing protein [Thermotoga]|jgi:hypothetical protein|uniref:DUF4912 domain-containing protein n=1 Tax=Thermotoga neapolitana (strain ATCC 49049 / DSM 4359 / NBRC 107923 / NS-E) TaxID=309803 RepID=B9K8E7_THENN|nr:MULTISPECIES: DUF4912 domain-containing protein [Thermotoga]MDK2786523.1 uncharacterized protein [Thermotoga sp.]HBF11489.1 DUF4912 domain-containing protein [Thermotoga neapolitana]ACM23230.1 Uncharacterized protein CTN_1054 [Thermotoga neapolitana DSM 4359]AJG41145.1 hypothetical protein TRQ7_06725 [Thermotoga sp. RQ7]KFZ21733.1 hypothetical protein LA10_05501 [Thermotoga neapolitana LA10]